MAAPRKYPEELRERAIGMTVDLRRGSGAPARPARRAPPRRSARRRRAGRPRCARARIGGRRRRLAVRRGRHAPLGITDEVERAGGAPVTRTGADTALVVAKARDAVVRQRPRPVSGDVEPEPPIAAVAVQGAGAGQDQDGRTRAWIGWSAHRAGQVGARRRRCDCRTRASRSLGAGRRSSPRGEAGRDTVGVVIADEDLVPQRVVQFDADGWLTGAH